MGRSYRLRLSRTGARNIANFRAELWTAAEGGGPGSRIARLMNPAQADQGRFRLGFRAPANTRLAPDTRYYAVFYRTDEEGNPLLLAASTAEDSGGAAGWSIEDFPHRNAASPPSGTWTSHQVSNMMIRIKGTELVPPFDAPTVSVTRRSKTVMDVTLTQPGDRSRITSYTIIYAPKDTPFTVGVPTAGNPYPTPEGWTRLTADDSCHKDSDQRPRGWCNGGEGAGWWGGHAGGNRLTHQINALHPTTEYCVRARAHTRTRTVSADGRFDFEYSDWSDANCNSLYEYLQTRPNQQPLMERCAAHLPANAISVAEVTGWRDAQAHDAAHLERWNRVLEALGEDTGTGVAPFTVAESRANEFRYMRSRWSRVTGTLEGIGACVGAPAVSLSAPADPVDEGSSVAVTVTLSSPLASDLIVPLTVTRGTSEAGDHGTLASLTVPAGGTSASGRIATTEDADTDDETFTVALGALPASVRAGTPATATVTIKDTTSDQQPVVERPLMERCAAHLPANAVSVSQVTGWRDGHAHVAAHVERWNRVLEALGADTGAGVTAMTVAEARENERRYMPARWTPVRATLEGIETCLAGSGQPAAVTEVLIAAGAGVTEGAAAGFTLTAHPAPGADLSVSVALSQSGAIADASALGERTVTIAAGASSAAFTVATVDDAADEPDGAIVATLAAGTGYTLGDAARATVAVADDDAAPPEVLTKRGIAREGTDEAVVFTVHLSHAAGAPVTVDWATADAPHAWAGAAPAAAGADYTAASGTLTFAAGSTLATVKVPLLDDAIDEGTEYFLLRFSNPQGATLASRYRETQGLIRNSDPLQAMWLARFGRMAASDAVEAVTARLETPRGAPSHLTLAGQRLDLAQAADGEALAGALAGLAQSFGGHVEARGDDPFGRDGPAWNDPAATPGRLPTGREVLLGSSFRAVLGEGAGSQLTSWGQGASVSGFSADVPGLRLSGESATGALGMDFERGPLLSGFALTHSIGDGSADDGEWRYAMGSTVTTMLPYARYALTERVSTWAMAGTGAGSLTLDLDGGVSQHYDTDLSMTLAAVGVRGELLSPAEPGGFALALKADAFWVRTESDEVTTSFGRLMGARGESSRLRAVLDGSRTFALAGGRALSPSLELGLRHDGGDAETGTGLELGAGLGYADPSRGLDMAFRVHGLAAHAEEGYSEWGVSGQLRLVPGGTGRGLSASLTPSFGVDPGGSERLWALPDASGLASNGGTAPSSRVDAEVGYGLPVFGGGFTGTPNVGLGLSDTARDLRMGWRLSPASGESFELNLDATRREPTDGNDAEHGVVLTSRIRW